MILIEDIQCDSFRLAKDAGFKVITHMMPDLPNVDFERDIVQFKVMSLHAHSNVNLYNYFLLISILLYEFL